MAVFNTPLGFYFAAGLGLVAGWLVLSILSPPANRPLKWARRTMLLAGFVLSLCSFRGDGALSSLEIEAKRLP